MTAKRRMETGTLAAYVAGALVIWLFAVAAFSLMAMLLEFQRRAAAHSTQKQPVTAPAPVRPAPPSLSAEQAAYLESIG